METVRVKIKMVQVDKSRLSDRVNNQVGYSKVDSRVDGCSMISTRLHQEKIPKNRTSPSY